MKQYTVHVKEIYITKIRVMAESEEKAKDKVEDIMNNQIYPFDAAIYEDTFDRSEWVVK